MNIIKNPWIHHRILSKIIFSAFYCHIIDFYYTFSTSSKREKKTFNVIIIRPFSDPLGNVSVELQYLDTLYYIDKSLEVIEYDSFNLICFGSSSPKANYSWSGKKSSPSYTVEIASVNRSMNGIYTCHAVNEMQRLNGTVLKGDNDVSIYLSVLCECFDIF